MEKIIKGVLIAILLILILLIGIGIYENISAETQVFSPVEYYENVSYSAGELQFYPDMRFKDLPITYRIDFSCSNKKIKRVKQAFSEISKKTIISFTETQKDGDIFVSCNESHNQQPDGRGMFIAGEGGPLDILRTGLFYLIRGSKVLLFTSAECDKPNVEIHEILHALGFGHSNNKKSIMYPVVDCKQYITPEIINELNRLYSFPSLPDLKLQEITAIKKGRYLDFNLTVKNQGLKHVDKALVSIYSKDERIYLFDLNNITVGGSMISRVWNLRLPSRKIRSLSFIVDYKNEIREINESNNRLDLFVKE